eukprot:TRINITY_DN2963_c0_g1_i1.p1 TRINITY_DN2963_c0_g1~~TRINITY_DN2963_c0_g1_i1.p1  ORF type:complete len:2225 (-),score=605.06 TRINITY_DN2963_c0_g1_i1:245-6919(-)
MTEKLQQQRQFNYHQTSNLVLITSERTRDSGPSTEVLTLSKIPTAELRTKFGDRAMTSKPAELKDRIEKAKKKREHKEEEEEHKKKKKTTEPQNVLTTEIEYGYKPQTKETKQAYEVLLSYIQTEMGDKPHDVLRGAADEVLEIMKDDSKKQLEKKKEVEALFRLAKPLEEDRFSRLVAIVKSINDWNAERENESKLLQEAKDLDDEKDSVPVILEEKEEKEEDDQLDEIKDEEKDEEEEEGADTDKNLTIESKMTEDEDMLEDESKTKDLNPRQVDAFWLQRELAKYYKDPLVAQQLSDEVFSILSSSDSENQVENQLVLKLETDKFAFIRLLTHNRSKIVYCTKLARAKDEKERKEIENQMSSNSLLKPILDALQKTSTAAERNAALEHNLTKESRALRKGTEEKDKDKSSSSSSTVSSERSDPFWTRRPKAILDIDNLSFDKGAQYMSNTECKLPPKSEVINKKGYQEVHIPAVKAPSPSSSEKPVLMSDMPDWARPAFKDMKQLNRVQSRVYNTALLSAENMLICAPTGAGKTNIAMLAMLREIGLHRNKDGTIDLDAFKIVYVAPMKSLVQEMVLNFGKRLEPYGIKVKELSGDQQLTKQQIQETQVIITTPEKWDIITRKSGDRAYTQLVRLVIIDEIHLLHDSRGPVLESIVARTIRQIEQTQELIRLVGLSATLPNYEDVALFLRVKKDKGLFFFDSAYRPVPLQQQYIGITQKKAFKRYQLMNEICYEKVMDNAGKQQIIIFVHTRNETVLTAKAMRDMAMEKNDLDKFLKDDSQGRRLLLKEAAQDVKSEALKDLLPYGFAIHNAGMLRADRTLVEDLFADGHIQVLVSTATLAWGVNLPAHTVIIKGTQVYSPEKGKWVELSPLDVMQMIGRAGRPQYDSEGEGIIITGQKEIQYYLSLLNEQLPVESQYMSKLADNLNAEIVLGSVQDVKEAVDWLGYTYLYVRMLRRPQIYGISVDDYDKDKLLEQRRIDLIHSAATILDKHGLVKYDRKTGQFQVTDLGRVASHYYITHQSMQAFNEYLKPSMSDIELFRVFSLSSEFKFMNVREEEKLELAKLLDKVPIPVKESIEEASAKVNVLLQAYISRLKMEGFALIADMVYITQSAARIMRAMFEIVLKRGWAASAEKCLNLCKMIQHRQWAAQSPLRQFQYQMKIPPEIVSRIEGKDFSWERLSDLEAHAIGELIRFPKQGPVIHKAIHLLPKLEMQGHVQPITRTVLRVELTLTPDFKWDEKVHGFTEPFWLIVEDIDGETILHYEYFVLKKKFSAESHTLNFTIPIYEPMPPQYFVRVISDRWLGSETVLPISFRHLILPEKFAAPTELLDLQPLSIKELGNDKFTEFYKGQFDVFNPIQTQVFPVVYKKDSSLLLASPTGSGKTVIAELAIMRMLTTKKSEGRCVYIAPSDALAEERMSDWTPRFSKLGVEVQQLTGEASQDLKLMNEAQIIVSTPEKWDIMSRRWKARKGVQNVSLFIVDELHLIGGEVGPVLEVIVSRMRFIATQIEKPIRILGMCTSVANAEDLGKWIGAPSSAIFNFHPNNRPVPLEIRIQGFDINSFSARQLAMIKPTYQSIKTLSLDKPVIVFVPSRRQARRVALDVMTYVNSEDDSKQFLHADAKDIEPLVKQLKNLALKETLQHGVAFYHKGLPQKDRTIVQQLFKSGAAQVLITEYSLAWGMTMSAHLVVIMGTQYYDGNQHRYVDCSIADVIQMMGRASRPLKDPSAKCTIMCPSSKKEFYKKFLYEPFPVESHLDHFLADHMNAEIIAKRIENVQDAVDYLTWSFFYRRITQNPNYYNMQGVSHRHLSDHLSELVESTLDDLQQAHCISIEESELSPLNLGMIAAYYYIRYTTVELFATSLTKKSKLKGLLGVVCAASEFDPISVRPREDIALQKLSYHLPLKLEDNASFHDAHTKAQVLLQAHFSRIPLTAAVQRDLDRMLPIATRLLHAMVDVISSNGWLAPALACMELSQMICQALWNTDSPLFQLPHFTKELVQKCRASKIDTITDIMEMEDKQRNELLSLSSSKMRDIALFCNSYPDVEIRYELAAKERIVGGSKMAVDCELIRDPDVEDPEEITSVPNVAAPRYPQPKSEGWWLVLGNPETNELVANKRVAMNKRNFAVHLEFNAPEMRGKYKYILSLMSDSYLGVDQEYPIEFTVAEGKSSSEAKEKNIKEEKSSKEKDSDVEMSDRDSGDSKEAKEVKKKEEKRSTKDSKA